MGRTKYMPGMHPGVTFPAVWAGGLSKDAMCALDIEALLDAVRPMCSRGFPLPEGTHW